MSGITIVKSKLPFKIFIANVKMCFINKIVETLGECAIDAIQGS